MEIRALTQPEQKYTYAQSMQLEGQTGCIGHLRGDFAPSGYGFYTSWFDAREQWKTDEFKAGLDEVINALREDKGLLHNRYEMAAFARKNPESALPAVILMKPIPRWAAIFSIYVNLPNVWRGMVRFMSRSPKMCRRRKPQKRKSMNDRRDMEWLSTRKRLRF